MEKVLPVKNEEEAYEKMIEMSNNNDYTTGNVLDLAYFKQNCKLIAIDLRNKLNQKTYNKLILLENLKQQCFSSLKNQKKQPLIFHKILLQSYKYWKHKRL